MKAQLKDHNGFVLWTDVPVPPAPVYKFPRRHRNWYSTNQSLVPVKYEAIEFQLKSVDYDNDVCHYEEY